MLIIPGCKLIWSSFCEQIAALLSCQCCSFCLVKLGMLLSLGLVWPGPTQGLSNLKIPPLSYLRPPQVLHSQQAATHSHSQSGQCSARLEARSEACSASSLKPKQDHSFNFPNSALVHPLSPLCIFVRGCHVPGLV